MSRRRRAEKRQVDPDPVYQSEMLTRFINRIMVAGKKSLARRIVYGALQELSNRVKVPDPLQAFEAALENAKPQLEVKSRRIGGATYQVPLEVSPDRQEALAMRWIIQFSRSKPGCSMVEGLARELSDCYNKQGTTVRKRDETHRMAESNKAFAHYR